MMLGKTWNEALQPCAVKQGRGRRSTKCLLQGAVPFEVLSSGQPHSSLQELESVLVFLRRLKLFSKLQRST